MNTLMGVQIMLAVECFPAYITGMRSISSMRFLMANQIRLISESLAANLDEKADLK